MMLADDARPAPLPTPRDGTTAIPLHDAASLTAGGSCAHISLNDQTYILRITRAGKLILTK
jgi:hemin uptake protein HemP